MRGWLGRAAIASVTVAGIASAVEAAEVKARGVFHFPMAGLSVDVGPNPRVLLWCQGTTLLGVVVLDDGRAQCGAAVQKRELPRALVLRDGRCEADGRGVSFGFLVARKSWLFDSGGRLPEERSVLLLHRFEGSIVGSRLSGSLVQVDVSHPGYAFQKKRLEAEGLPSEQPPYSDEAAWHEGVSQIFCLASTEH